MDIVEGLRTAMDLTPFYDTKALHREAADLIVSLRRERDEARVEITRLRDCLRDRPNTFLIAHEDGDHERLTRVAAKAIDRAESAEAEVARLREALRRIDSLDEADGYDLRERHAFEAVAIARTALETKP